MRGSFTACRVGEIKRIDDTPDVTYLLQLPPYFVLMFSVVQTVNTLSLSDECTVKMHELWLLFYFPLIITYNLNLRHM